MSAFQRRFVNEVRRCDEMERKLRYLEKEMKRDSIALVEGNEAFDAPAAREMVDMEVCLCTHDSLFFSTFAFIVILHQRYICFD